MHIINPDFYTPQCTIKGVALRNPLSVILLYHLLPHHLSSPSNFRSLSGSLQTGWWAVCLQHRLSESASLCRATTRTGISVAQWLTALYGYQNNIEWTQYVCPASVAGGHDAQDSPAVPPDSGQRVLGRCNESSPQLYHLHVDVLPAGWWWQSCHFPGIVLSTGGKKVRFNLVFM